MLDRFELGEWLGEGSLSVVYAARDRWTGRDVAIKVASHSIDASTRQRFEREAAALAVIASPHVVELVAAGVDERGRPYLALERLDGRDLQEVLDEHGPLRPAQVTRFLAHAARALEVAHGLGIVHRDLKPANLFLHRSAAGKPMVKVLDFGLVVDLEQPVERTRDAIGGTPLYMAPEQVRGQLVRIGPATDVWALAHVAITLLTGEPYWTARTTEQIIQDIDAAPIEPPSARWSWLPAAFDAWFLRATRRVPERRFQGVAEQAAALAAALRDVAPPSPDADDTGTLALPTLARQRTPTAVRFAPTRMTLVGREVERRAIDAAIAPGAVVTLTGTAGIGKTRLARAILEAAGDRFVDGAWSVPVDAARPLDAAIAGALRLAPDTTRPIADHVAASLGGRELLFVVDGADQDRDAATTIDRLRRAGPGVAWLVTSRLPLGIADERCVPIEPLDLPRDGAPSPAEASTYPAIELFVQSAGIELTRDNVADVVAICRAVEGFPLGLELAAAQLAESDLAQVRAGLERDADAGSSLRRAIAASHALLPDDDRAVLRRLAYFPAGLTFEQARASSATLGRLLQRHLLVTSGDDPPRLVMLATVREVCIDDAVARGEDAARWADAHRHAEEVAAGEPADAEHENLHAVLAHLIDTDPPAAMRLAGQLAWYWYVRGHYVEGARWLNAAIERGGDDDPAALIRALHGAGRLALLRCAYLRAETLLERARGLARAAGDARGEAEAVQLLGSVARERGDYARAREMHARGLELWLALGEAGEAARARNYLVFAGWLGGDAVDDPAHDADDAETRVWTLLNRGAIHHHAGRLDAAREALTAAIAEAVSARFHEGIAWSLDLIGRGSLARGELLQARAQLAASLRVHRRLGDLWRCASVLDALAAVAVASARDARAATYLGAAEALRTAIDVPVPACERALVDAAAQTALDRLGDAYHAGRERGRRTPLDQVIDLTREG